MVSDDAAARAVWLGTEGALAGAARGSLLVECSTASPAWVDELAREAAAAGCDVLDAPVTGSRPQAAAGELLFLVGGAPAALERARPVLAVMSRAIVHVGATGQGALLKLVNNFMCGVQAASLAEALVLLERSGLDRAQALDVLTNGAAGSPLVKTLAARMTARDYTPNFVLKLMAKDLSYAIREGQRRGVPMATPASALGVFEQAVAGGQADQDFSAVVEPLRKG
jgi:3-hydroxyisobutyrate dehydrogenase